MGADKLYRLLAFAGGLLVAGEGVSIADLTALATSLLADINTIAGALVALSPDGLAAARSVAAKLTAGKKEK